MIFTTIFGTAVGNDVFGRSRFKSIRRERAANYGQTKEGVGRSYHAMCEVITCIRRKCTEAIDLDAHLEEDE